MELFTDPMDRQILAKLCNDSCQFLTTNRITSSKKIFNNLLYNYFYAMKLLALCLLYRIGKPKGGIIA
jgi:hypothetical protein